MISALDFDLRPGLGLGPFVLGKSHDPASVYPICQT
jgi:hypothetical protein